MKKDYESVPFVRRFILPSGMLVGPRYELEWNYESRRFAVSAVGDFGDAEGTDEELAELRISGR